MQIESTQISLSQEADLSYRSAESQFEVYEKLLSPHMKGSVPSLEPHTYDSA